MSTLAKKLYRLRLWRDTRGQDLIEYAMIAGFIAICVAATFPQITSSLSNICSSIGSKLDGNAAKI